MTEVGPPGDHRSRRRRSRRRRATVASRSTTSRARRSPPADGRRRPARRRRRPGRRRPRPPACDGGAPTREPGASGGGGDGFDGGGRAGRGDAVQRHARGGLHRAGAALEGRLEPTEGTVHASETVHVDAERPLSVQVYAKCNVQVLEPEAKVFGLPSGDWASELTFRARALEAGPVEVSVVLRQAGCRWRRSPSRRPPGPRASSRSRWSAARCTRESTPPSSTASRASTSSRGAA